MGEQCTRDEERDQVEVFQMVTEPYDKRVIEGRWALERKGPDKVRARCAARENARTKDADCEFFASTSLFSSFRCQLARGLQRKTGVEYAKKAVEQLRLKKAKKM